MREDKQGQIKNGEPIVFDIQNGQINKDVIMRAVREANDQMINMDPNERENLSEVKVHFKNGNDTLEMKISGNELEKLKQTATWKIDNNMNYDNYLEVTKAYDKSKFNINNPEHIKIPQHINEDMKSAAKTNAVMADLDDIISLEETLNFSNPLSSSKSPKISKRMKKH